MGIEAETLRAYVKAVAKYWWAIVTGFALTILDGVERLFGTWYRPTLWVKLTTAVAGVVLAKFLAYRDLARAERDLRQRNRDLETNWFEEAEVRMVRERVDAISEEARHLLSTLLLHAPIDRGRLRDECHMNQQEFDQRLDEVYRDTGLIERYPEGGAQFWRVRAPYVEALRRVLFPPPRN